MFIVLDNVPQTCIIIISSEFTTGPHWMQSWYHLRTPQKVGKIEWLSYEIHDQCRGMNEMLIGGVTDIWFSIDGQDH